MVGVIVIGVLLVMFSAEGEGEDEDDPISQIEMEDPLIKGINAYASVVEFLRDNRL